MTGKLSLVIPLKADVAPLVGLVLRPPAGQLCFPTTAEPGQPVRVNARAALYSLTPIACVKWKSRTQH